MPVSGSVLLPALYAHRVLTGAWKWLRRPARVPSQDHEPRVGD